MRIISGTCKGRKLNLKGPAFLRPMTNQAKEMIFNVLSPFFFEGCFFLDLFSGTGQLAIEALSRGAKESHAVEKDPTCLKIIKKNALILPHPEKLLLHKANVFSFLKQKSVPKSRKFPPFHIIIADPPFRLQAGESLMQILQNSPFPAPGSVVAIETSAKESLKINYGHFYLFSQKAFSDKKIWFYVYQWKK